MSEAPRFELDFPVRLHMTDTSGLCRAADMMRFMQETAIMQLEHYGPNLAEQQKNGQTFVLSRISIDFPVPVTHFDVIRAATWPCTTSRGVCFDRHFILSRAGTEVAAAASQWAFLDVGQHRFLRAEDCDLSFARDETVKTSIPPRFRIPKDAVLVPVGTHPVQYSDIDNNFHMNNTRYCDLYCDFLPMEGKRIAALAVAFLKEATVRDTITVTRTEEPDENGLYYIRTYRSQDNAVNTEAVVRLEAVS